MEAHWIYVYTKESWESKFWHKIGQTVQDPRTRVEQQDGTSDAEPNKFIKQWSVPIHITDKVIHKELQKMGFHKTRLDKDREWFVCPIEAIDKAINNLQFGVSRKNSYAPREEQIACINQAVQCYKKHTEFLINGKPRFGKCFTAYQLAKEMGWKKILVLTYKPSAFNSWREDLENHVSLNNWNYQSSKDFSAENPIKLLKDGITVLTASFQDINDFDKPKWKYAKNEQYDAIIIDEMHFGSETERANLTKSQLKTKYWLHLSGTPLKALIGGKFLEEQIYTWTYADEQREKKKEEDSDWLTDYYRWQPKMNIHIFKVCEEVKNRIGLYSKEEGFTFEKMFGSDDGESLNDESSVKLWADGFFGKNVKKIHSPIYTYPANHMLWVLDSNKKNIKALCKYLRKYVGDEYHIIDASNEETKIEKVKQQIQHYQKTITVTCVRFNTGVTVPEWDMVVMLNNGSSPETYIQTIFRCQNADRSRNKQNCYVIDYNPQRCLRMIYAYNDVLTLVSKSKQSTQNAIKEFLEFAPILDHSGNTIVKIETARVLDFISDLNGDIERFGNQSLISWDKADGDIEQIFSDVKFDKNLKIEKQVADSNIDLGKNFKSQRKNHQNKKENKSEFEEFKKKVRTVMRKLPAYLFITDKKIENVSDILKYNEIDLFSKVIGIELKEFSSLKNKGFVNESRLNKCIMEFDNLKGKTVSLQNLEQDVPKLLKLLGSLFSSGSETLTDSKLVKEMLSKIDKNVWSEPKSKLLDPCCGKGSFLIQSFINFMNGLEYYIKDIDKRAEHIVKYMLFGVDNNEIQYLISKKILKIISGFEPNVYLDDSLTRKWNMKFNAVIGNPPFNIRTEDDNTKTGVSGKTGLFKDFTKLASTLVEDDGILAFITPKGIVNTLQTDKIVSTFELKHLNFMSAIDVWEYDTCYFILQNNKKGIGDLTLDDPIFNKILDLSRKNTFKFSDIGKSDKELTSAGVWSGKTKVIRYLPGKRGDDVTYDYTDRKDMIVFGPKVVVTHLDSFKSITATDEDVLAGTTFSFHVDNIQDAEKLALFLRNSKVVKAMKKMMKFKKSISAFKLVNKFDLNQIKTGLEYPREWNLTNEEIKQIEGM